MKNLVIIASSLWASYLLKKIIWEAKVTKALFLPGPKNYSKVDIFQDLKIPNHLQQQMLFC